MYFKSSEILEPLKSWFLISPRAILYTKMGPIFKGLGFDLKILNQIGYQMTQNGFVHIYTNIYIDMYGHFVYHTHSRTCIHLGSSWWIPVEDLSEVAGLCPERYLVSTRRWHRSPRLVPGWSILTRPPANI